MDNNEDERASGESQPALKSGGQLSENMAQQPGRTDEGGGLHLRLNGRPG